MSTTLITQATIINEGKQLRANLLIRDERIEKILPAGFKLPFTPDNTIDANGSYLLPGVIDDQVHFREPGLTHKGRPVSRIPRSRCRRCYFLHGNAEYLSADHYPAIA